MLAFFFTSYDFVVPGKATGEVADNVIIILFGTQKYSVFPCTPVQCSTFYLESQGLFSDFTFLLQHFQKMPKKVLPVPLLFGQSRHPKLFSSQKSQYTNKYNEQLKCRPLSIHRQAFRNRVGKSLENPSLLIYIYIFLILLAALLFCS